MPLIHKSSVSELARFSECPQLFSNADAGIWRMEVGRQWHDTLAAQATELNPHTLTEFPVDGILHVRNWQIQLKGRIDQWIPAPNGGCIREIKTIQAMEGDDATLRRQYPEYILQTALYGALMLSANPGAAITMELAFVDIADGMTHCIKLDDQDQQALDKHLNHFVDYLEHRRQFRQNFFHCNLPPPFSQWREGQQSLHQDLQKAISEDSIIYLEAPTGFGKTGVALDVALHALQKDQIDRIVYLTGKSSGQIPVVDHLRQLGAFSLRYFQMRNRSLHQSPFADTSAAMSPEESRQRWEQLGMRPHDLFEEGSATVAHRTVMEIAEQTGIDAYAISRLLLRYAEVWIGDYNYLFHPGSHRVFTEQPNWDPARTLVLIDEAHNLPARVADAWSCSWESTRIAELLSWIHYESPGSPLIRHLDRLLSMLNKKCLSRECEPHEVDELLDWLQQFATSLEQTHCDWLQMPENTREALWDLMATHTRGLNPLNRPLYWRPKRGEIRMICQDPSAIIKDRILPLRQCIFMTATLGPLSYFQSRCGLQEKGSHQIGEAPWMKGAYSMAVDQRADTRYQQRRKNLPLTAQTIADFKKNHSLPVVVFTPSFDYASQIEEQLAFQHPYLRSVRQPSNLPQSEQATWIEEQLPFVDIMLLVMGSRFAEGIDMLGGRIERAIVVGPALPSPDPVLEAKTRNHPLPRAQAFEQLYQIPGMIRVSQSIGRLVRAPGQQVSIILHCQRFAEPTYQNLLPQHCQGGTLITNNTDLNNWLETLI